MKHVAIVTKNLRSGGAERVISQLLNEWSNKDVKCTLILLEKTERFYSIESKVEVIEIGDQSLNRYINKLVLYKKVRSLVKEIHPDIILSLPEEIGIYVVLSCLGCKVPIVVSERNNPWVMPYKTASRIARIIAYQFVDGLIFQTEKAKSFFARNIQKKGIVLPNPLDINRIPDPWAGEKDKIIVSAGRLEAQKNFSLLIDAFAEFYKKHKDYKMVIYGEGSEREMLEKKIKELQLEDSISLPGNNNNLLDSIRKASLFVLSSDYEGIPNVLIEAMATGIPVVSTDCEPGGAASLINSYENGLIIPVKDKERLCEAIFYMIEHKDEAEKMSYNALKVKKRLDAKIVCDEWYDFLCRIIENT